jgi:hypothetical protein
VLQETNLRECDDTKLQNEETYHTFHTCVVAITGNVPVKALSSTENSVIEVNNANAMGTVPVNLFDDKRLNQRIFSSVQAREIKKLKLRRTLRQRDQDPTDPTMEWCRSGCC